MIAATTWRRTRPTTATTATVTATKTSDHLLPLPSYELPWDGRPLAGPVIAFDTETNADSDLTREVPRLILMQVYDGQRAAVLRPDQVLMFIHEHKDREWVAHNARFDYWVLQKYLAEVAPLVVSSWATRVAQEQLQAIADQGRLHDTKILDFLLQLATQTRSEVIRPRSLKDLVYDYLGKDMPKDQYREDFTQIEGKNWQEVDRGFFDYAVRDAVGTFQVYQLLAGRARAEARKWSGRPTYPAAGLLTEALQVRADLALAQAGRTGLAIDRDYLAQLKHDLEAKIQALTDWFDDHSPALFHRYRVKHRRGELKLNKANGLPVTNYYVLRAQLIAIAAQLGLPEDSLPRSKKTGVVSTSLDYWRDQARGHEFVEQWVQLVDTAKMLQFVRIVERQPDGVARTDYQVLVRTGRTSAREPNIQNMPKEPWFRRLFVARPGTTLVIADYSAIELVTLAAVLTARFGRSTLADVLREGRDPHSYTAALLLGKPYEEVRNGVKAEKAAAVSGPFSQARQSAKAVNFGVPGGLGARRLAQYAKVNYGVDMSEEQARELRTLLITEVYPELSDYLKSDDLGLLAKNLWTTREALEGSLERASHQFLIRDLMLGGRNYLEGDPEKVRYLPWLKTKVYNWVVEQNRNPEVNRELARGTKTRNLDRLLWGEDVWTLTGRKRAGVTFTEARNTPFQGLAADGAKVALWAIHQAGFRLVAFVHDEVVVEVPTATAEADKERIVQLMQDAMAHVLGSDIPVGVEAVLNDRWLK